MGKKYTTDIISIGDHNLDASMMASLNTVVANHSNYLTTVPNHNQAWSTITSTPTTLAGYGITDSPNLHEWEWYWVRYAGNVTPTTDTQANWETLYKDSFINETAAPAAEGYVNTINDVGSEGGFGGSAYGNLYGNLDSYHTLITTNILVTEPFSISITNFIGDDSHAIFIDGAYVKGVKVCCSNSSYSYTFTKGWHRIDLIYGEGGGGDYIKMGWNPKDYTDEISEMYAHLGVDNPNYTLERLKAIDGSGSGLDADLLDGQHGSHYLNYNNLTNKPTIPTNNNQLTNGAGYVTSSGNTVIGTDSDLNTSGSTIIDNIYVTDGVITSMGTRTLTASDIGAAASSHNHDSRYYTESESDSRFLNVAGDVMTGVLTASGGINGLTLSNGISGSNFNITGVNQLSINDPGEGIVFGGGSNNVTLYAIDDSTDNKMNFGGASELQVNGSKVWHAGNDGSGSGLDADKLDGQHGSHYLNYNNLTNKPTIPSGSSLVRVYENQNYVASSSSTSNRGNFGAGLTVYEGFGSGTNKPHTYDTTLQIMSTTNQGFEMSADWVSSSTTPLKIRSLRDCCQGWSPWRDVAVAGDVVNGNFLFADNVGIGTTSPGYNLVVGDGTQDTESRFYFNDGSYTSVRGYGLYMSRTFSYIRPVTDESQTLAIGALNSAWGTISNNALLHTFGKDSSEFMRINSSGNVGIGTTSPSHKLHVNGVARANEFNVGSSNTMQLFDYSGNLHIYSTEGTDILLGGGIGSRQNDVTIGDGNLHVNGTGGFGTGSAYALKLKSSSGARGIEISDSNGVDRGGIDWSGSDFLIRNASDADLFKINYSSKQTNFYGNVGIGTTSPSYPLDVAGTVDATSFRAGGISKYTTYNSTNTYENYGTGISNIASSPVGYLYHDLLAFNYNYTITQESLVYQGSWQSETLEKRLFSQKQDQAITVVSSSEYAVRWTIEGTAWNTAKFINLAFTYTNPHPETRVIIESSADGTTWTSRHDSTASGITGTKSCYVSSWGGNNYVRITISKTSNNTNLIKLSSIKMMTARAGDQGDGHELQYPYVWDENRNMGLLLTKSDLPTSKLDILGATNTSNSSLLRLRSTSTSPNASEKVAGFYYNTNTQRGYIGVNQYGVTYSTSSDYRLKENVVPLSDATERLKLLKPCRFNFIESDSDYVVDGFLAHEAAEVVPESVNGEKDAVDENNEPIYQGIDQSKIVPLLTAALQEAIQKIEQLENRIQTLENN